MMNVGDFVLQYGGIVAVIVVVAAAIILRKRKIDIAFATAIVAAIALAVFDYVSDCFRDYTKDVLGILVL